MAASIAQPVFAGVLAVLATGFCGVNAAVAERDEGVAARLKLDCARLSIDDRSGAKTLHGHVVSETDIQAAKRFASEQSLAANLSIVPWPACEAMVLLGPALDADDRPKLSLRGGNRRLKIGEPLVLDVVGPGFSAFVYAVYLQADGTVVNLLPRTAVLREQDGPRFKRSFGDGSGGFPKLKVSPPKGHEAVIALASRVPISVLEELERPGRPYRLQLVPTPGNNENKTFLSVLKRGLENLVAARDSLGPVVTASVLNLEIGD